jgi:steroid 5-alpha reductase family enzyme
MLTDVAPGLGLNLLVTAAVTLACVLSLWLLSIRIKDVSIVDIFWGPAFGIIALVGWFLSAGHGVHERRVLVTVLTVAWAARLGIYLFRRNHGKGEDPRYTAAFRDRHSGRELHLQTLKMVFLLQGFLAWLISIPVQLAQYQVVPPSLGIAAYAGTAVFVIGFLFEAVGDRQLARFKADPANRGRVMDRGLWRYTRHPNYFGNACLWFGLWLIACDHWSGFLTVFSPLLMTHFLVNVTGKKLLEKRMGRARPEYADYVARTSGFFPWFPKPPGGVAPDDPARRPR